MKLRDYVRPAIPGFYFRGAANTTTDFAEILQSVFTDDVGDTAEIATVNLGVWGTAQAHYSCLIDIVISGLGDSTHYLAYRNRLLVQLPATGAPVIVSDDVDLTASPAGMLVNRSVTGAVSTNNAAVTWTVEQPVGPGVVGWVSRIRRMHISPTA